MNEVIMLRGAERRKILQTVIGEKVPAIMSYSSRGKWHVAKGALTDLGVSVFNIAISPRKTGPKGNKMYLGIQNSQPINIQMGQPVGISLKYGYGKFIFDTTVVGFEPSPNPTSGGLIALAVPEQVALVQRRSYLRVRVPRLLEVNVLLWHRCHGSRDSDAPSEHRWQGKLVDVSAGGVQIAFDATDKPNAKEGQFVKLRFTPIPYEAPFTFSAQIRTVFTTANDKSIRLGLQMVGLEASAEGRLVLQRLCNVVEQYYQLNQSTAKQRDFQTTTP